MKAAREQAANDQNGAEPESSPELTNEPSGLTVTPPKSKPKSKPISSEGDSPLPPIVEKTPFEELVELVGDLPVTVPATSRVIHAIPATWQPSESLRADATMSGVSKFEERLAGLRSGPIGGTRGVFERDLEDYIRTFFGKWRTWEETDRAKEAAAKERASAKKPWEEPAPKPPEDLVKGLPRWVRQRHEVLAGTVPRLRKFAKRFAQTHHIPPDNLDVNLAAQAFEQFLTAAISKGEAA